MHDAPTTATPPPTAHRNGHLPTGRTTALRTAVSPFTTAYRRLSAVHPGLQVTEYRADAALPTTEGWVTAAELATGGPALDSYLQWDAAQVLRDHGRPGRPDVLAGFGLHRYAWPACLLITAPWLLERRVPRIAVEDVAFDRERGRLAVRTRGFACLPGDPAALLREAHVVPDEEALAIEARQALAAHLAPLMTRFGPLMRRRGRALWGMATDEVSEGLWYVARLLGVEEEAVGALTRLLPDRPAGGGSSSITQSAGTAGTDGVQPAPGAAGARPATDPDADPPRLQGAADTSPFAGSAAFRTILGPDGSGTTTRDRVSCCLFYTLRPDDTCETCPRTCDTMRLSRRQERPARRS